MPITVTKEQLTEMDPCGLNRRLALFGRKRKMNVQQAKDAGASIEDVLWVAGCLGLKRECVEVALRCAQAVAHFNGDPCVQAALDATQTWLDNPTSATRTAAGVAEAAAAYTARIDADAAAAHAARAAAYAAGIAAAAAYAAAAYAARAARAAHAAHAADGAADAQWEIVLDVFGR